MAISFLGSSTGGGATNGGNVTLTLPSSTGNGDVVIAICAIGSSRAAPTLTVTTSVGAETFTQIVTTIRTSNCHFGVFRRVLTAARTQAIFTGTANTSDTTAGVAFVYRGVDNTTPEDVAATSTNGSGTTPDSPSITVASSVTGIITCFGAQINDTAVTAPSSFLNTANATANDNWDATIGAAWITYSSTTAINPGAWSGLTSATWASATIALRQSTAGFSVQPTMFAVLQ